MRKKLYEAQDEIDKQKENLLDEVEGRLKQNISEEELFTIKWRIV